MALVLEWDFEQYQEDDLLIALHTRFVPCKLAYWLNKVLGIRLERSLEDLYDRYGIVRPSRAAAAIYQRTS